MQTGFHSAGIALPHLGLLLGVGILAVSPVEVRAVAPPSPASVIARGEERFRGLRDYHCRVEMRSKLGSKVERGAAQFWFKQPRMLRVRVTAGPRKGSEVALDARGQIRGRKRGLLGGIVKNLKPSDQRLSTIRGTSMLELDWGSFFRRYRAAAARPKAVTELAAHPSASSPYSVAVSYPGLGKSMREVYTIDPVRWVIVEGALYENNTLVEHVVFRDIVLDPGLSDGSFKL